MFKAINQPAVFKKAILVVFLICLTYWLYLAFASQMKISQDAIGYERLGLMIHEEGWKEYFITGPNNEPFYPFTIAFSMKIADLFSISYQLVQKIIQLVFLFTTQILILYALNKLRINNAIKLGAVLYFGFSPAMVNSSLILFSEILVYPFVVAAVLFGTLSWSAIHNSNSKRIASLSFCTSCAFGLAALDRAIFQYVFLLFLIPYFFIAIGSAIKQNRILFLRSILYILVAVLTFNSFIIPFKLANKRFNGSFKFVYDHSGGVFGCAAKRAEKLTFRTLLVNLASIPGERFCRLFFTDKECWACEYHMADYHTRQTLGRLLEKTPKDEIRSKTFSLAFKKAIENPWQQILLIGLEALKMPFWESAQIGFVQYPIWLQNLFNFKLFKNALRLLMTVLTYCALIIMILKVFKQRQILFSPQSRNIPDIIMLFIILWVIITYTALHSVLLIINRYSLPLVPLYIIGIAYFLHINIYRGNSLDVR